MREEIEKFAHVIFSSSPAQREFWSGRRSLTLDQLRERFGGCKPCLHGSDAHDQKTVGRPVDDRFSWLKGGLGIRCPAPSLHRPRRPRPCRHGATTHCASVTGDLACNDHRWDWATTPEIPLNPGLVAIIGARGSGKTALADMIAAGCDAITPVAWRANENASPSFLVRARKLLGDASATLTWGGGATVTRFLDGRDANSHLSFPRARYLSQQFVEELCSANGVSDGLIAEIERVIFEAHSQDDRDGAIDFAELRDYRTARFQQARERRPMRSRMSPIASPRNSRRGIDRRSHGPGHAEDRTDQELQPGSSQAGSQRHRSSSQAAHATRASRPGDPRHNSGLRQPAPDLSCSAG